MRKSTFLWRELYRFHPLTVERCACIWMINGARTQIQHALGEQLEVEVELEKAKAEAGESETVDALSNTTAKDLMELLDATHQYERRVVLTVLLVCGLLLTLQPWLTLNFFSLPMLMAGAMLLGLEFSPRGGQGFVGMAIRLKEGFSSKR